MEKLNSDCYVGGIVASWANLTSTENLRLGKEISDIFKAGSAGKRT